MTKKYFIYGKVFHRHFRILIKLICDLVGVKGYVSNEENLFVDLLINGNKEQLNFVLSSLKSYFRNDEIMINEKQINNADNLVYTNFDIV